MLIRKNCCILCKRSSNSETEILAELEKKKKKELLFESCILCIAVIVNKLVITSKVEVSSCRVPSRFVFCLKMLGKVIVFKHEVDTEHLGESASWLAVPNSVLNSYSLYHTVLLIYTLSFWSWKSVITANVSLFSFPVHPSSLCQSNEWHSHIINVSANLEILLYCSLYIQTEMYFELQITTMLTSESKLKSNSSGNLISRSSLVFTSSPFLTNSFTALFPVLKMK